MTTPTPNGTPDPATTPASTSPAAAPLATPEGYLAATVGGLVGGFLFTAFGVLAGIALMEIYDEPGGGMEDLALLLYPLALGALGLLVGIAAGVRVALERIGAAGATRTAWLTVPFTVVCLFLMLGGLGMFLVPGVPVVARLVALQTRKDAVR